MDFELRSNDKREIQLNWEGLKHYISRWKCGTLFKLSIVRQQSTESDPMRKYYFSTVLPIAEDALGYDPDDDLHRWFKIVFFKVKPDQRGIHRERDIPSVFSKESLLPLDQKWKFIQWVSRKAAEHGGYVPDPRSMGDESLSRVVYEAMRKSII